VPLFAGLSLVGLERLAQSARASEVAPGQVVVRQGEPAADFYVVAAGSLSPSPATARRSVGWGRVTRSA